MFLHSFGSKSSSKIPPNKPESVVVCETLMNELDSQIKETERISSEKESEEKRRNNKADYSWLVSKPKNSEYRLSPIDRLVLEELCTKVLPCDSGRIITQFRTIVESNSLRSSEVPNVFRCVIERCISESSNSLKVDDSGLKWVTRSLSEVGSGLRTLRSQSSGKVYPSVKNTEDDNRRTQSMPEFIALRNLPV